MNRLQIPDAVVSTFDKFSRLSTEEAQKMASLLEQYPIGGDSFRMWRHPSSIKNRI